MHMKGRDRRRQQRNNHYAKELAEPKYRQRIKEEKRQHMIDEIHEREAEEELQKWLDKQRGN